MLTRLGGVRAPNSPRMVVELMGDVVQRWYECREPMNFHVSDAATEQRQTVLRGWHKGTSERMEEQGEAATICAPIEPRHGIH